MNQLPNENDRVMELLLMLNGKVQMLLDDMDDLRETMTQLKFHIESQEEERTEMLQSMGATKWKKETL